MPTMPAPSTDSADSADSTSSLQASSLQASSLQAGSLQASSPRLSSGQAGQVPSQSKLREFNRRRALIEYTLCNDEDIWAEMKKEALQAKSARKEAREKTRKPKSLVTPTTSQLESINAFLLDTFQNSWNYNQRELDIARQNLKPEMISPANIDWDQRRDQRRQDIDPSKSGQYLLNPETQNLNFEKAKVFIPEPETLEEFEGKPRTDVAKHIQITYGSKYHIPGIEYWQYISQNPNKAPQSLKNSKNYYFYFGSILYFRTSCWCGPVSRWDDLSFKRNAFWIGNNWYSDDRVVLLDSTLKS